jgi:hypothetical protein
VNCDLESLTNPSYAQMTDQERLLRVVMLAYIKQIDPDSPAAREIGWTELTDALQNEICNAIGDRNFIQWLKSINEERPHEKR